MYYIDEMGVDDKKDWLEDNGSLNLRGGVPRRSSWKSHGGCVFLSWDMSEKDIVDGLFDRIKESLWKSVNSIHQGKLL